MADAQHDIVAIFAEAVRHESAEARSRFVDEACGSNPQARQRVETLLRAHFDAGNFLGGPAPQKTQTLHHPPLDSPGAQIGPYKLLQEIGQGGMGVVYMAEQHEPVRRKVALKIIKPGMDTRQVIARFEAERQALSLMDHPNIARVLDAGTTESGRPYFVMELVKGQSITHYCDEKHLTTRQRLELLLGVCQAIQHAHQKGIIHRDVKPSNVLVAEYDGRPVAKVIDFGVAKALSQPLTEKTMFTDVGQVVGTLEYMSPEQAKVNQLDVDTRSDIYSLGVLLYELLTGSTPFDKERLRSAAWDEMLRIIREEEPQKPSTKLSSSQSLPSIAANRSSEPARLSRTIRGELDWIVMKALEKDRNRRYETANGFAHDIQRYLSDEPVQACPPSALYRFRKFVRRNKGILAVGALVLFFLVLSGSGIGWAVRDRSAREAEIAQERANREADLRREREDRKAKVAGQVETILNELDRLEDEQKWPEALAVARRAEAAVAGGEADAHTAEQVRQRLKDLAFLERLEQIRLVHEAPLKRDAEYGRAFRDYGVDVEELAVESSIERLRTRPALIIALAATLDDWASLRNPGVKEAEVAGWERLVAIARGIDPEPLRDLLRSSWGRPRSEMQDELRRVAASINVRVQHPATLAQLAIVLRVAGFHDAAHRILREAQLVYPGDYRLNYLLALHVDGNETIRFYTAALAAHPKNLGLYVTLGMALERLDGKLDEAAAVYRRLIEIEPKGHFANQGYLGLAHVLQLQAMPDEAIAVYREAIADGPAAHYESTYLLQIGEILEGQRKLKEAIAVYRRVIELNPNSKLGGYAYYLIGNALRHQGNRLEAIDAYRTAIDMDPNSAVAYSNLGALVCSELKDDEQAIEFLRKSLELDSKQANTWSHLGTALAHQGNLDDAIAALRTALKCDSKHTTARNNLSVTLNSRAWTLATNAEPARRDSVRAVSLAKEAVELQPQEGAFWNTLGTAQYQAGDPKAAILALEKSMELRNGGDSNDWFPLAMAHWQLGEKDKARAWYDRAVEWMDRNQPNNEELRRFRTEATELLDLKKKQDGQ